MLKIFKKSKKKNIKNLIELYTSPGYIAVLPESFADGINIIDNKFEFIKREKYLLNHCIASNKDFFETEQGWDHPYEYCMARKKHYMIIFVQSTKKPSKVNQMVDIILTRIINYSMRYFENC